MANHTTMPDEVAMEALEQIVDSHGIQSVMHMLERICELKAEHVLNNWQDESLSEAWAENATKIGLTADGLAATD